ncbi:TPA: hypothetical protein ACU207_001864 [Mannheimia haemolytica]|uniref:hypothetical protein n=1 Tax=Pasteurellaceae TaxID=712 RepID=UPI001F3EC221|nr:MULTISPECIES: hypothetical protein [Pasteurellaceae]UKH32376.1 hypothetical protein D1103_02620 [Actinobacillus pleuropneumoniae serovar 10 str. D13039]UQX77923.1 hypothetical protein M3710_03135 [Mannheimia haemolytica]
MKFIEKQIENDTTGALASCHVLSLVTIDYDNQLTSAIIKSFVSKDKKESGKQPIFQSSVTINAAPDFGQSPNEWVLSELIKPAPDAVEPFDEHKYVFAGGKIKDCEK